VPQKGILLFIWRLALHLPLLKKLIIMGRGDKKTKKGKIFKGSFGKSRPARPAKKAEETKA
jgi:30S ribosomal protein S31